MIDGWRISCESALRLILLDLADAESTLDVIGAVRQQAITWANVDPDLSCHKVSLGHNELTVLLIIVLRSYTHDDDGGGHWA